MPTYRTVRATRPLQDDTYVSPAHYGAWYARQGGDRADLVFDMRGSVRYTGSPEGTVEGDLPVAQGAFDATLALLLKKPWLQGPGED